MLVTEIRGEALEAAETTRVSKNGKKSKGKYPEKLAQVLYIQYPIIFWKKSVPMLALLDLRSEVNAIHPIFAQ